MPMTSSVNDQELPAASGLARVAGAIPAGSGAVVMGSGIVSIDLEMTGEKLLSLVTVAVAGLAWALLGLLRGDQMFRRRQLFPAAEGGPAGLSSVAGTAVLGTRLTLLGWRWAGAVLLILAVLLWLGLLGPQLRHRVTPTVGASFLLCVSTESLAVLLATLGVTGHAGWLVFASVVPLTLGVGLYGFVIWRFDLHQLLAGRGDQWVAGGALAISALACAEAAQAASTLHLLGGGTALRGAALVLWVAAACWLPVLLVTELISPRGSYEVQRWSTVFPVAMYAACSFAVGTTLGIPPINQFARIWTWAGFAVWAVVLLAMLWQPITLLRAGGEPGASSPPDQAGRR
ncbi:MAG: tellurite resistance/C4-dicarboxylate transporter family protein [Candidatus Dormiibacterota bacterium]